MPERSLSDSSQFEQLQLQFAISFNLSMVEAYICEVRVVPLPGTTHMIH